MKTIRPSAAILGLLLSAALGVGEVFNGVIRNSSMSLDFTTGAAIFVFFALSAVNLAVRRVRPDAALRPPELLLIYIMLIVACTIPTMGIVLYLVPGVVAPVYFASPANEWAQKILPHIRPSLLVRDPEAVRAFFEGIPPGVPIPWKAWIGPLSVWALFLMALYFVMVCMMVLVRRQWVERERLIYPVMRLPREMVEPGFFRDGLMWTGFGITFVLALLGGLHGYRDAIPAPTLGWVFYLFRRTTPLFIRLNFPMMGFAYLISSELGFSLWFFYLLQFVVTGVLRTAGALPVVVLDIYSSDGGGPVFSFLQMGAVAVLGGMALRKAWAGRRDGGPDAPGDEILPLPAARAGLAAGFAFLVCWLVWSGLPAWAAVVFLTLALLTFFMITRVLCEGGLAEVRAPMLASSWLVSCLGPAAVGARGMVAFALTHIWHGDIRTFVMGSVGNGLKLAERIREKRLVFAAIMATIIVVFTVSTAACLVFCHRVGALNVSSWFFGGGPQHPYRYAAQQIDYMRPPFRTGWTLTAGGAAFTALLTVLRHRFLWWPLHPLGFAFCGSSLTVWMWFSIFCGWLMKFLLLKYGGQQAYRRGIFFCLGMIAGPFVAGGVVFMLSFLLT